MSRFVKKLKNTLLITLLLVFIILFVDLVQNLSKNGNSIVLDRKPQRIHSKFTHLVKNVVQTFDTKNTVTKDTLELPESVTKDGLLKDWHDYKFIEMEKSRTGLGEQGKAAYLYDHDETRENDALYEKTGFSVLVSNKISVNRSLPDQRHEKCKEILYLRNLSSVSVIVIFYNEILSVLKRTLHSVWNRTPVELLHEIILVNDNSSYSDLYEPLENYVNTNFPNKVTIINLKERKGLMVARMEGARKASGKILLFLDSHIEVNTNYLPPLIEPIVRNKKIGTVPIHEYIEPDSFEVILDKDSSGSRGVVDWKFDFHEFGKRDEDRTIPYKPFPTPIMLGCAFAIDRSYFFELGGFDEGMRIWNGENYEMSFKLWLCGGGLYQIPCSRVAHSFRDINPSRKFDHDYVARNFLRVAEVWLDDYKGLLIASNPDRYKNIDPGDLTEQKALKRKLDCKPFKYFLDIVAPDMVNVFPPFLKPPVFASGVVKNVATGLCITRMSKDIMESTELLKCSSNSTHPKDSQNFFFSFHKNIVHKKSNNCLDSHKTLLFECNSFKHGNQYWKYDLDSKILVNGIDSADICLTAVNQTFLDTIKCDPNDKHQKWEFGYVNETALNEWDNIWGYHKFL